MENQATPKTSVVAGHEKSADSPEELLRTRGYLVLPRPFRKDHVENVHRSVRNAFDAFDSEDEDVHRTLYEFSDEDSTDADPRFYERGRAAIPRMDFKGRTGYKQLMMTLEFSTEFARLFAGGQPYVWGETHGPQEIKNADHAFSSVIELFSTQAMESIFAPVEELSDSYCGFLLNDSAPFSVCFGYHYELHQDRHENAVVISVQLSPPSTPWKIGRDLDSLGGVVQDQGSMVVMEALDYENRMSPWHMPCIGEFSRNAAVVVLAGIYRERFMDWLAEHATACGFGEQEI